MIFLPIVVAYIYKSLPPVEIPHRWSIQASGRTRTSTPFAPNLCRIFRLCYKSIPQRCCCLPQSLLWLRQPCSPPISRPSMPLLSPFTGHKTLNVGLSPQFLASDVNVSYVGRQAAAAVMPGDGMGPIDGMVSDSISLGATLQLTMGLSYRVLQVVALQMPPDPPVVLLVVLQVVAPLAGCQMMHLWIQVWVLMLKWDPKVADPHPLDLHRQHLPRPHLHLLQHPLLRPPRLHLQQLLPRKRHQTLSLHSTSGSDSRTFSAATASILMLQLRRRSQVKNGAAAWSLLGGCFVECHVCTISLYCGYFINFDLMDS